MDERRDVEAPETFGSSENSDWTDSMDGLREICREPSLPVSSVLDLPVEPNMPEMLIREDDGLLVTLVILGLGEIPARFSGDDIMDDCCILSIARPMRTLAPLLERTIDPIALDVSLFTVKNLDNFFFFPFPFFPFHTGNWLL